MFLFYAVSLAVWQDVTVKKGQTLTLMCPVINAHMNHVDWKNPDGLIMFFNRKRGEHVNHKHTHSRKIQT